MPGIPDVALLRLSDQMQGMRELSCHEASVLHSMDIQFHYVSGWYGAEGPRIGIYWYGVPPDSFLIRPDMNRYFI